MCVGGGGGITPSGKLRSSKMAPFPRVPLQFEYQPSGLQLPADAPRGHRPALLFPRTTSRSLSQCVLTLGTVSIRGFSPLHGIGK